MLEARGAIARVPHLLLMCPPSRPPSRHTHTFNTTVTTQRPHNVTIPRPHNTVTTPRPCNTFNIKNQSCMLLQLQKLRKAQALRCPALNSTNMAAFPCSPTIYSYFQTPKFSCLSSIHHRSLCVPQPACPPHIPSPVSEPDCHRHTFWQSPSVPRTALPPPPHPTDSPAKHNLPTLCFLSTHPRHFCLANQRPSHPDICLHTFCLTHKP